MIIEYDFGYLVKNIEKETANKDNE